MSCEVWLSHPAGHSGKRSRQTLGLARDVALARGIVQRMLAPVESFLIRRFSKDISRHSLRRD